MKELTIEQKAKRYNEALEKAREELQACGSFDCDAARQIFRFFPELKESEDERKELIELISCMHDADPRKERWLAWLEKQEEKSVNKLQVSGKLYEHIRNTCAYIEDAISSETLADINDYLLMAERSADKAFDIIEQKDEQKPAWSEEDNLYYDDICEILVNLLYSKSSNVNKSAIQKDLDWFITFVKQTKE